MATKPQPDVRFIVDVKPNHSSLNGKTLELTVTPVVVAEDGKIRNPSFGWINEPAGEYDGLCIEGRCDETDTDFWFGTDLITFDIHRLDQRRAEAVVKTFRRLERRFAAQDAKWGRAVDSAAILSRVADAIGSPTNGAFGRKVSGNGWSYDDNEYRWMDVDALRLHLNAAIKDWKGES